MKDQRLQVADIVRHIDDAMLNKLDVPEFQRKYVWAASKVTDLVDSLWRGYPIGTLLLWESSYESPQAALGTQGPKLWIVDGQQRVTSLALLFGKKPYWWLDIDKWNDLYKKCDVLVNINEPKEQLEFGLVNPVRKKSSDWLSVRSILASADLTGLAVKVSEKLGDSRRFAEIHEKLQSIRKIGDTQLYEIIVDHELEDVAEIFRRLNTAGTKIRESDIVVALVASKQKGWIRERFNPFLKQLEVMGFEFDPSVVVRTLAIIGHGSARLKDIPRSFWEPSDQFNEHWLKTKEAIHAVTKNLVENGVLSSDLLPSLNVLIPVFVMRALFPQDFTFARAFGWLLIATRDGRYGGSATTVLDQDAKLIRAKNSFDQAIADLTARLSSNGNVTSDDFRGEYSDKFLRLIYYLTVFDGKAKDWLHQDVRIGFDKEDNELNEGFNPEWHHIFPRKVVKDSFDSGLVDSMANIAVLNEKANRAFSSKIPVEYLKQHNVKPERLAEQSVPVRKDQDGSLRFDEGLLEPSRFEEFLKARADELAKRATTYVQGLTQQNL